MMNVRKKAFKILPLVTGEEFFSPLDDSQHTKDDCALCSSSMVSLN